MYIYIYVYIWNIVTFANHDTKIPLIKYIYIYIYIQYILVLLCHLIIKLLIFVVRAVIFY
jgi:hypothetical protein